jgi:hypothetical protein
MKAILVGRHAGDIPGVEVIEQRNITFALNVSEAFRQLEELLLDAHRAGAGLLLQNTPGIIGAVLYKFAPFLHGCETPLGVIISVPGERQAGIVREFNCDNPMDLNTIESAVKFANGRAAVASAGTYTISVTVDPVPQFAFSHIEWLIPTTS